MINTSNRLAHELFDEAMTALRNAPAEILDPLMPKAYGPRQAPKIAWPTTSEMTLALSRTVEFVKVDKQGTETYCAPPAAVVRSVLESWKALRADAADEAIRDYYRAPGRRS